MPEGVHSLAGTQFDLRARLDLRGAIFEETGSMLPRAARGIRVGRGFRRLQALHAASWWDTDGAVIGAYVLKYADGAIAELPIVYGRHLRGWVGNVHEPMQATEAVLAWTGSHSSFASPVRLFKAAYENPRPDLPVESIDVVSNMAWAAPMVVALTVDP